MQYRFSHSLLLFVENYVTLDKMGSACAGQKTGGELMNRYKKMILVLGGVTVLGLCCTPMGFAADAPNGVVLNEACAKNTAFAAADGAYYDWIELYNSTGQRVDLSGYGLTDDPVKPGQYVFPTGTILEAGGRMLVFCDAKAVAPAGQLMAPFGLSKDGETLLLTDPTGKQVDTIAFGAIGENVSYGRVPDGSDQFAYLNMSPDQPNQTEDVLKTAVDAPIFSKKPGFYDAGFDLTLSAPAGTTIYYTLDGSDPTTDSQKYTGPIAISDVSSSQNVLSARTDIAATDFMSQVTAPTSPVDKAMILRAIAVDANGASSSVATGAYFIGYQNRASFYRDCKVISLVTDSDNLFDYEKGIYVLGKTYDDWRNGPDYDYSTRTWEMPANYMQSGALWERPASMQIFENGSLVLSQDVGIRIHGGATRSQNQKSFNVYARSNYGAAKVEYDLFSGKVQSQFDGGVIDSFDSFMLRNAGNDSQYTRFRDKLNQSLVSNRNLLTQGMEPCIVFVDGEFWGHYEITEKLSDSLVKDHYGIKKKDVCIIKNEELDEGTEEGFAEFTALYEWVKTADLSDDANYKKLCAQMDIQSFMDYMSAEFYYNNTDWGQNNMAMWKSMQVKEDNPYADGKWRFILFDTEYSTNLYGQTKPSDNSFAGLLKQDCFLSKLFSAALQNDTFRRDFCLTFMDMANENFKPEQVTAQIEALTQQYKDMTLATYNRFWPGWPGGQYAQSQYNSETQQVRSFYRSRFDSITSALAGTLSLQGRLVSLTVRNDESCGTVQVNSLTPDLSGGDWTGKYYTDMPVTLTAAPKAGYQFAYWNIGDQQKLTDASCQLELTGDVTVQAVYTQSLLGDVDLDGDVDVADLVQLQRYLLRQGTLTSEQAVQADLTGDQRLDAADLVRLRRMLMQ